MIEAAGTPLTEAAIAGVRALAEHWGYAARCREKPCARIRRCRADWVPGVHPPHEELPPCLTAENGRLRQAQFEYAMFREAIHAVVEGMKPHTAEHWSAEISQVTLESSLAGAAKASRRAQGRRKPSRASLR